ncbi:MAG: glycine zipper 2TM domain-containing protein [Proteobacteria bacterium]|nr:glycine zipper 2TM domain-containing protein [Pseudomonadota bacterium]
MKKTILALTLVSTLALGACAQNGENNPWGMGTKQTIGTGAGAIVGGFLGSKVGHGSGQLWATGAGALLGALAGSSVGQSLDQADRMYHQQAAEKAYSAPLNEPITWNNPESGHSGTITPVREGKNTAGNVCRQFKQAIMIDGQAQTATGTACQNNDGSWTVQN